MKRHYSAVHPLHPCQPSNSRRDRRPTNPPDVIRRHGYIIKVCPVVGCGKTTTRMDLHLRRTHQLERAEAWRVNREARPTMHEPLPRRRSGRTYLQSFRRSNATAPWPPGEGSSPRKKTVTSTRTEKTRIGVTQLPGVDGTQLGPPQMTPPTPVDLTPRPDQRERHTHPRQTQPDSESHPLQPAHHHLQKAAAFYLWTCKQREGPGLPAGVEDHDPNTEEECTGEEGRAGGPRRGDTDTDRRFSEIHQLRARSPDSRHVR
ncbi:hypothetical protein ScPMuIL_003883 [Solemya velum]